MQIIIVIKSRDYWQRILDQSNCMALLKRDDFHKDLGRRTPPTPCMLVVVLQGCAPQKSRSFSNYAINLDRYEVDGSCDSKTAAAAAQHKAATQPQFPTHKFLRTNPRK
jgi:hypothetical protein